MGLVLCRLGFAWQLRRDWRQHGLTYVAPGTLACLSIGSSLLAFWLLMHGYPGSAWLSAALGMVETYMAWLKYRDWWRTQLALFRRLAGRRRR